MPNELVDWLSARIDEDVLDTEIDLLILAALEGNEALDAHLSGETVQGSAHVDHLVTRQDREHSAEANQPRAA